MRGNVFSVENHLKRNEKMNVAISDLEHFVLIPGREEISILSTAENACAEGGRQKFSVRGVEMAEIRRWKMSDEMKMLTVERTKAEAKGLRVPDTARAGVGCEGVSEARSPGCEVRYLGEVGVGVGQRVSPVDHSSMSSAGSSQKNQWKHRKTNRASRTTWM